MLRPLNDIIRHPQNTPTCGNLRDFLMKLTRSPTVKYRKSFGFTQISRLKNACRSHSPVEWTAVSYEPLQWLHYGLPTTFIMLTCRFQ